MGTEFVKNDIKEAIGDIEKEIEEKKKFLELLKSFDLNKNLTEDEWHELCKTPLRHSKIMELLLKNIFPEAENIKLGPNYVYFTLYGFKCSLPTSYCRGIDIDTTWYKKLEDFEDFKISNSQKIRLDYINAKRNNASWLELSAIRSKFWHRKEKYSKIELFFLWFLCWRWEDFNEEEWLNDYEKTKEKHEKLVEEREKQKKDYHEKCLILFNKLIPELNKFTDRVYKSHGSYYELEEIKKLENI